MASTIFAMMPLIREHEERDVPALRACIVALQEFERTLDPRLLPGEAMADGYWEQLDRAEACARNAGATQLRIGVLAGNTAARRLYLAAEFEPYLEILEKRWST